MMSPRERLIVALDTPTAPEALALVARLQGRVGMFKVGSELFTAAGPGLVRDLVARGEKVFLDLKFHDIPNTVAGAVAAACQLGVSLLNLHALGGPLAIRAGAEARGGAPTRLLAITILTSHDEAELARIGLSGGIASAVERLALMAREAGADGVVASAQEAALVRRTCGPGFLVVTPGIRPGGEALQDQARAVAPAAALRAGADYIVVGRPITKAPDPVRAVESILEEMAKA
jgi:orotidine-5'-phosphate decarboxylase